MLAKFLENSIATAVVSVAALTKHITLEKDLKRPMAISVLFTGKIILRCIQISMRHFYQILNEIVIIVVYYVRMIRFYIANIKIFTHFVSQF